MSNKIIKKISELRNWDKNPRSIKPERFEELKVRINKYGQFKSLIITADGEVLGGNMRLRAYRDLGIDDIWVSVVEPKTEAEKIEIALTDNEEMGYYEDQVLAELIAQYKNDIDLTKYSVHLERPKSLDEILQQFFQEEIIEDEAPSVSENERDSRLGEVYQLGRHRLMCGDATKIEDVEKLMDGKKADMVFTDPPYNVSYVGKTKEKLTIKNDSLKGGFEKFLYDSLSLMRLFVSGDVYVCMSSSELHTLYSAFVKAGGHWSTFIIWVKNHFTLSRSNYQRQYEPILYGWFDGSSHHWSGARNLGDVIRDEVKQDEYGVDWIRVDAVSMDVWSIERPTKNKDHPTMKPQSLCARAIKNSSVVDGVVLDLFGGSGSTLIACEQTNRTCYMMELDPKYCDVIRKRYMQFTSSKQDVF